MASDIQRYSRSFAIMTPCGGTLLHIPAKLLAGMLIGHSTPEEDCFLLIIIFSTISSMLEGLQTRPTPLSEH